MAKKAKLNFKPTPISRLSRMAVPFKMVGDPDWNYRASGRDAWANRERAVYQYEIERKGWPMAWKPETWVQALADNARIDVLLSHKWAQHEYAVRDNMWFDYDAAERDNAAWDYHHEYTPDLEVA